MGQIINIYIIKMSELLKDKIKPLDEEDINLIKRYGMGPYAEGIKEMEEENIRLEKEVKMLSGVKESDSGVSMPSQWDLMGDKQLMGEHPLMVARCTKIINKNTPEAKYMINIK